MAKKPTTDEQIAIYFAAECAADPVFFIENVLGGEPWAKQVEILRALKARKMVAIASCHGAGKSWLSAMATLWFLYCHEDSRVITTAPTFDQVKDILWVEIGQAHAKAIQPLGGKLLDTRLELGVNWFAMGRATNDANTFQGKHSATGHILAVVDEAAGVKTDIWVAVDAITTSKDSYILAIGNPTASSGEFYNMSLDSEVYHICISAFDTPNFVHFGITIEDIRNNTWEAKITEDLPAPYLVTPAWVARRWKKWCGSSIEGEDNILWVSRVLGKFPTNADDSLIPLSWIEAAMKRTLPESMPNILAADIARFGSDESVIGQRNGPVARILLRHRMEDTMLTTGRVVKALADTGASEVRIDTIGVGAGVYDRLVEQGKPAIEMQAGNAANNSARFLNVRAEWYWHLRDVFESGNIDLEEDEDLAYQLSNIKYKPNSAGKIQIESKEEMRARLRSHGMSSPDLADVIMMLFAEVASKKGKLSYTPVTKAITGGGGSIYAPRRR